MDKCKEYQQIASEIMDILVKHECTAGDVSKLMAAIAINNRMYPLHTKVFNEAQNLDYTRMY